MHHYKYMGYSIIYHQRIAVLSYFFHSGIFVPYSVFYPGQIKNLISPTPAKKLLPSVANTFRGRANTLFSFVGSLFHTQNEAVGILQSVGNTPNTDITNGIGCIFLSDADITEYQSGEEWMVFTFRDGKTVEIKN